MAIGPLRLTWQGIRARFAEAVRSASSSVTPHVATSAAVAKLIACGESTAHSTLTKGTSGLPKGGAAEVPAPDVLTIAFAQLAARTAGISSGAASRQLFGRGWGTIASTARRSRSARA